MNGWMNGVKEKDGRKDKGQRHGGRGMSKAMGESSARLSSLSAVTTCSSKRCRLEHQCGLSRERVSFKDNLGPAS